MVADVLDDAGAQTVTAVEGLGSKAIYHHLDATSAGDNEAAMQAALDAFGALDIVVTAAGISNAGYRSGDLEAQPAVGAANAGRPPDPARAFIDMPMDDWRRRSSRSTSPARCWPCSRGPGACSIRDGGLDHHHRLHRRQGAGSGYALLRRVQGGRVDADQARRPQPGFGGDPGECHRPRLHRDQHDRHHR